MTDQPEYADGGIAPEGSPMPPMDNGYILPKRVTDKERGRGWLRKINDTGAAKPVWSRRQLEAFDELLEMDADKGDM